MVRVVFMCGPSGSGKTTYARGLEAEGMVRLSFDALLWERGVTAVPPPASVHSEVADELRTRLLELVASGQDVVCDFSFWSRDMRDSWRSLLAPTGVVPETVYLATPRETVLERVRARQGVHADDAVLSGELAAAYVDHFEPPTPDEGPLTVVQ
ncbi:hypothetical protein GCM10009623_23990 [Nocardioides aestuarii]|uniref:AAA family ATPase n=1 Tax=Nocardioides aestuarii TaxID=252231 RepID=A0ABW4TR69_9ACTN